MRRRWISMVFARAEQPPAPKPAATMPVPASAPSAKALGKRKTTDVAEPQRASKQPKLRCDCRRDKVAVNRRELDQAAAAQRVGEAIAYNELESKYSQPIVKFRESHKSVTRAWRG